MSRNLNSAVTTPSSPAGRMRSGRTVHAESHPASLQLLGKGEEAEALAFLAKHPVQNVIMMSLIRDNGFESRLNRGNFYACRDAHGELTGVALIGRHVLFATECPETVAEFARQARTRRDAHVIVGDRESVEQFWAGYARSGESPLLVQRELLLEQKWPIAVREFVPGLRLAVPADIEQIATAHAQMAFDESRSNPLETDREGFLSRIGRRVEQGRVWVWTEDDHLIFKTDICSHTPEVIYLEGVYVNPSERGKGYGLRCLSQLSRELLLRAKSLCLLVNEQNGQARAFYQRAGYKLHSHYDTIYLQSR
ncbi:MAG TPA: GNAT family N-acetyltransferase [Pyrinomonadaceae bacterium]|jgi:GNAT superfamily N-acetyltransferase|nr:GNAT family N-acetyltransferase [Pyrinomonadaceae bacterium]